MWTKVLDDFGFWSHFIESFDQHKDCESDDRESDQSVDEVADFHSN